MSHLLSRFKKSSYNAGAAAEIIIDMDTGLERNNNILVIERRLQLQGGGFPKTADATYSVFLGPVSQLLWDLTLTLPIVEGTYQYTTTVLDNTSGNQLFQDVMNIVLSGTTIAPQQPDTIGFQVLPEILAGRPNAIRVIYTSSITSGIVLEWNVYRLFQSTVESLPVRTQRYDMNGFNIVDIQMVLPVPDPPGEYQWEFRILNAQSQKVLSSQKRLITVLEPKVQLAPPAPSPVTTEPKGPDVQGAPSTQAASAVAEPASLLTPVNLAIGLTLLGFGVLAGHLVSKR